MLNGFLSTAQSFDSIRIVGAVYDMDNNLVVHVELAEDEAIIGANLLYDNEDLSLNLETEALPVEQWFILDSGVSMINSYSLVADELRRLSKISNDNVRFGGIIYSETPSILDPADSETTIDTWLDTYQITANQSCILDALNYLPDIRESARIARQITVITGDNIACTADVANVGYPIDFIIIANQVDTLYTEIAGQSGGTVRQSTVLGFAQEISYLEDSLKRPVMALSVPMLQTIPSAELIINLADGRTIQETIFPRGEVIIPATATPTVTPIPPTATTVPPTATASDIPDTATPQPTDTVIPATEVTEQVLVPVISETATPIETVPDSPVSNSALIAGGGIAAVVVVLIMMALLLGYGRNRSKSKSAPVVDIDSTILPGMTESQLDSTQAVSMRQIASQLGPTLVANLANYASDTIYEIHRPVSILGRQIGSDILIADDNQISREHVRFTTRDDGSIWIIRLTRNPILINGLPMETTRQLYDHDMIQLSPNLQVRYSSVNQQEQDS